MHRSRHRKSTRTLTAAAAVGTALAIGAPVASARPDQPGGAAGDGASGGVLHPERDHAGAQVARMEGAPRAGATRGTFAARGRSATEPPERDLPQGLDVSGHQEDVDWAGAAGDGARFAYVKATEGTTYSSPAFDDQYDGAAAQGIVRGAYHFALPDKSSGGAQAEYFLDNGGGWSADGKTLPPALDIEYNPYGPDCYGLSSQEMVSWVRSFSDRVHERTGRYPMIYTSTRWWNECTGRSTAFADTNPLWVPRYGSSVGELPAGWSFHTIWQYADSGEFPGDQNYFNGDREQLRALAEGTG